MEGDVRIDCSIHLLPAGIDALVNDSLVSTSESIQLLVFRSGPDMSDTLKALTWGAYVVGVLCSLFGFLYLRCGFSPEHRVTRPHVNAVRHTPVVQRSKSIHGPGDAIFLYHRRTVA
jgi:hypothetical protein